MFNESTWTENNARSFVSLYEESTNRGIRSHRDWVSFCAVTVCLEGDLTSDGNLVISQFDSENLDREGNDHIAVKIAQGGIIASKEKVPRASRTCSFTKSNMMIKAAIGDNTTLSYFDNYVIVSFTV